MDVRSWRGSRAGTLHQEDALEAEPRDGELGQAKAGQLSSSLIRRQYGEAPAQADKEGKQAQPVQTSASGGPARSESPGDLAARGVEGASFSLPHGDRIQSSFGRHDLSSVRTRIGGAASAASEALGAEAYTTGSSIGFRGNPDLRTAAHEATHVVQQRTGVQLSGGIGVSGDRYERQADRVADLVVSGKSAEQELDGGSGLTAGPQGVVQRAPDKAPDKAPVNQPAEAGAYDRLSASEKRKVEDKLSDVSSAYGFMLVKQHAAVKDLHEAAKQEPKPPGFLDSMLKVAGEVALAAALGPVGAAITAKIVKEGAKLGTKLLAAVVADGVKKGIGETVKAGYSSAFAAIPGKDPRNKFFKSQRDTLTDTAQKTTSLFNTEKKEQIRQTAHPLAEATALHKAVQTSYSLAYTEQRDKTMDEWIKYRAMSKFGKVADAGKASKKKGADSGAVNLGKANLGDTSQQGILGVEIYTSEDPADPGHSIIGLNEMNLAGVGDGMVDVAKKRGRVDAMKVPKSVNGPVRFPFMLVPVNDPMQSLTQGKRVTTLAEEHPAPKGQLGVGISADGSKVWNQSNEDGTRWLKMYGMGKTIRRREVIDAVPAAKADEGIRKLMRLVGCFPTSNIT